MLDSVPCTSLDDPRLEARYDFADALTPIDIPSLTSWLCSCSDAPAFVDGTLTELGLPDPDLDSEGQPIPGSVTRKLLRFAMTEALATSLAEQEAVA